MHWPFCQSKCPYCDFNSHVRGHIDEARWRTALVREIDWFAERHPGYRTASVFFGGGTPSLMTPQTVAAVIDRVFDRWPPAEAKPEITLEANPSSVEAARFAGFRAAGVNRASLGVQALDDASLAFLGRLHSAGEALAALKTATALFGRVSFDLIYARPEQGLADWRAELSRALDLAGGHLSAYQLTIEDGTAFANRYRRGDFALPDEDLAADMFALTQDMTARAGLPAYEISNHAAPGEECRHNLAYWTAGAYAGIGPGAHGRLPGADGAVYAHAQQRRPEAWLTAVEAEGHGGETAVPIAASERAEEAVMMGLRLTAGIDKVLFERRLGMPLEALVDQAGLAELKAAGLIEETPRVLRATQSGRPLLDSVLARLLA